MAASLRPHLPWAVALDVEWGRREKGQWFQQVPSNPESGRGFVQQKEHPEMWQKPDPSIFLNVELMIREAWIQLKNNVFLPLRPMR